jgi:hypothetical protein
MRAAMALHSFLREFQCYLAISPFCDEVFQDFSLVINRPLQIVLLAVDLHKNFVQMPLPVRICAHGIDPTSSDFSGKYWAKYVQPVSSLENATRPPCSAKTYLF